jgi:hypothetical protein
VDVTKFFGCLPGPGALTVLFMGRGLCSSGSESESEGEGEGDSTRARFACLFGPFPSARGFAGPEFFLIRLCLSDSFDLFGLETPLGGFVGAIARLCVYCCLPVLAQELHSNFPVS